MPQFLERRFSAALPLHASLISLVAYVVTKIAVGIFAGGIVFSVLLPELQFRSGARQLLDRLDSGARFSPACTPSLGGFRAVAYTEALQTVILIVGSALVTYFRAQRHRWLGRASRDTIGSDMFNLWKPLVPRRRPMERGPRWKEERRRRHRPPGWYFNGNYPWLGMLFCAPIIGLWYWCTDQYIVQRALGAENETEARRGSIFAAC